MSYLMLKCTKLNFGWGSTSDPNGGAYSATSDLLARFKRSCFEGEWTEWKKKKEKGKKEQWR